MATVKSPTKYEPLDLIDELERVVEAAVRARTLVEWSACMERLHQLEIAMSGSDPKVRRAWEAYSRGRLACMLALRFSRYVVPAPIAKASETGVRALGWLELLVPTRVALEEIGDAHERITKLRVQGAPRWKREVVAWTMSAWIVLNGIREVVRAFMGKRRERG